MNYILFLDTNVFLDDILNRLPAANDCHQIFLMAEKGDIKIYSSSSCILTVIYFLKKSKMPHGTIIKTIENLLKIHSLVSPDENSIIVSLYAGFDDLEDAIQYNTALTIKGVTHFITSNTKDFKNASTRLPVMSPGQFLQAYNNAGLKP